MTKAKCKQVIDKALVQLTLNHPFFASIVLRRPISIEDDCQTAYVTLAGRIAVGTEFGAKLTPRQMLFLLAHEAMHYALEHGMRREHRDSRAWNVAADKVINDILKESNVGDPIEGGLFMDGARNFSAEQLYQEPPPGERGSGDDYQPGTGNDDLSQTEMPDCTKEELRERIAQEIQQAATAAKKKGDMPAGLSRLIDKIINPVVDWRILLERYMLGLVKDEPTWSKPRKKMLANSLYFPSPGDKPSMGEMVVIADTSGSITPKMAEVFVTELSGIIEKCSPDKVHFLHVDARVHQADEYTMDDLPLQNYKLRGGGGTDLRTGFAWIDEQGIEPDCCVVFSDLYTPFPEQTTYPLVWLSTTDEVAPVGETIRFVMED